VPGCGGSDGLLEPAPSHVRVGRVLNLPGIFVTHWRGLVVINPAGHGAIGWVCLTFGDYAMQADRHQDSTLARIGAVHATSLSPLLAEPLDLPG
jgi:hypothetical protein